MKFGKFEISAPVFGSFRLDGGSMFGSVPKNIWSKRIPADSENCIALVCRSLVIRDGKKTFLVDVGNGDKWTDKQREIYAFKNFPVDTLGFKASEITDVILTHLHFDHAGGISRQTADGKLELIYPQATIHLQASNLANAKSPTLKERASYFKENWGPCESGKLNLVNGSVEIYPDIWVHVINGHTAGQQWIEIRGDGRSMVFPSDLIPTAHHLPVPFHMGYDICAGTLLNEKAEFLERAEKGNWIVVFEHDRDTPAATVGRDKNGHFCVKDLINF